MATIGRLSDLENKRAVLVGVFSQRKSREECLDHLQELGSLCVTYGLEVVDRIVAPLNRIDTATFIGSGKVHEMRELLKALGAEIVVFDDEISPHQQRNLEVALRSLVIDRTELILGVFAKRARSKEAQIQVDLACYKYQLPRLKRMWTHLSRQKVGGGSGGYLKGAGEKQIEIDRRIVKSKIAFLNSELKNIKKHRAVQRSLRERAKIPTFAIIGYTNAGKSTLLNNLTGADVFVEDKLFATLDTTTRKFVLPNNQAILLTDTVGFIRKLPHELVASFKSTLEEAVKADILLHIIDVSNKDAEEQAETTFKVLKELNALNRPIITCLNKIDICSDRSIIGILKIKYPKTVEMSALKKIGLDTLFQMMIKEIALLRKKIYLRIPQSNYKLVSEIMEFGKIVSCDYEGNDILLEAEIPTSLVKKVEPFTC